MNWKKEICEAAAPPKPKRRDGFLKALLFPKLTYSEFVFLQIGYIRKRIWLVSLLFLLAGVGIVCTVPENSLLLIWIISAAIPFLAVLTAAEISRSNVYGMSEIEAGCRFALPQIAGARMIILGLCNFFTISVATILSGVFSPFGIAKSALYILTPYILVCGISLAVFSRTKGQDGVYLSGGAALAVSLAGIFFNTGFYDGPAINAFRITVCAAGTVFLIQKVKKILVGKDFCYGTKN